MGKLGGIILLATLALSGCATAQANGEAVPDPADPATYVSTYSADEFFIAGVKLRWVGEKPSNTELVKAGEAYCRSGEVQDDANGRLVAEYAKATYCP